MPIVNIHILEGRTVDQKRKMAEGMTKVICETLNVTPDKVKIIISNMAKEDYSSGGKLVIDS